MKPSRSSALTGVPTIIMFFNSPIPGVLHVSYPSLLLRLKQENIFHLKNSATDNFIVSSRGVKEEKTER